MTIGTVASGINDPVSTQSGPGSIKLGYRTRSWEGDDQASAVVYDILPLSRSGKVLRVRDGVHWREVVWVSRLKKRRIKVPREELVQHNYTANHQVTTDLLMSYYDWNNRSWYTGTGRNTGYGNAGYSYPPFLDSDADIALIGRLRNKIAGSDFNLAVSLAEANPALKMIASSATRLYRAYRFARRGSLKAAADALTSGLPYHDKRRKVVARNWLELQYGWLPLLNDISDAAEYLANLIEVPAQKRYRARLRTPVTVTPSVWYNTGLKGTAVQHRQLVAYVKNIDQIALSGLQDPASVVWEMLPYSFVGDWIIPIGNYLAARGLASSLSGIFVKTVTNRVNYSARDFVYSDPPGLYQSSGLFTDFREVDLRRVVMSSLDVPMPRVKRWSDVPSWKRAANAVSLLVNLKRF